MGRSQRHRVLIQNTDSTGKGLAEKQPAPVYINQYANSQAFAVPVGPAGGSLQGSSMAGYPPVLIPAPGALEERSAEVREGSGDFASPGQFNLSGNPIYESLPPADGTGVGGGGGPEPEPGMEPTLTSIDPATAVLGDPDVTVHYHGTNFTESSVIYFAGQPEPIAFISPEEITTIVKPSLPWGAVTLATYVQQGAYTTDPQNFTFTEAAPEAEGSGRQGRVSLPAPDGPVGILKIEKAGKNLLITVGATNFRTGDWVRIEATGNSTLNGDYRIGTVKGATITVNGESVDLLTTINERGRIILLERD